MTDQPRITACLPTSETLQTIVATLQLAGFDRAQFGVLGIKAVFEDFHGHPIGVVDDATDDAVHEPERAGAVTGMLVGSLAYAGAIVAAGAIIIAGGGLGVALLAAVSAGSTGGLVGALVAHGFDDGSAQAIEHQVNEGGLVLWISPRDDAQRALANAELARAGARIIDDHEAARQATA